MKYLLAQLHNILRTNVLLQNELPELPTLQRDGVRNVIFLRTPPFPKMSSLLFINSYSRWSLINTLENVVLLSQVPPSLAGPCCSTIAASSGRIRTGKGQQRVTTATTD